jgi:hypothetical protein
VRHNGQRPAASSKKEKDKSKSKSKSPARFLLVACPVPSHSLSLSLGRKAKGAARITFEQKERGYYLLLWGALCSSFASSSTPGGCLLQLIHGLDEGAPGAKSQCKKSNSQCEGFSIQATGYFVSGLLQIKPEESRPVDIERPDSRHRVSVGYQCRQYATAGLHLRRWPRRYQLLAADPVK